MAVTPTNFKKAVVGHIEYLKGILDADSHDATQSPEYKKTQELLVVVSAGDNEKYAAYLAKQLEKMKGSSMSAAERDGVAKKKTALDGILTLIATDPAYNKHRAKRGSKKR